MKEKKKRSIWSLGWRGQKRIFILHEELREPGLWHEKCVDRAREFQTRWSTRTFPVLRAIFMRPSLQSDPQGNSQRRAAQGCFRPFYSFLLCFLSFLPFGCLSGRGEAGQCLVTKS